MTMAASSGARYSSRYCPSSAGPWLFQAKYTYTSGNKANDDINNRGIGSRADVKYFAPMNNDGGPFYHEWFEIFGTSDVDGTGIDTFRRMSESGGLETFGWQQVGGAVEYKATDNLILEGAAGGFWAAQKPGCPAVVRRSTSPPVSINSVRNNRDLEEGLKIWH